MRGADRDSMQAPRRAEELPDGEDESMDTLASTRFPTITAEALAALQARLGRPVPRPEPYIEVATRDAIRHWAHGIGDR